MTRKGLDQKENGILLEDLPSDYEANTDEEDENTTPIQL